MMTFDEKVQELLYEKFIEYYQEHSYDRPAYRANERVCELMDSYAEQIAQMLFDLATK